MGEEVLASFTSSSNLAVDDASKYWKLSLTCQLCSYEWEEVFFPDPGTNSLKKDI